MPSDYGARILATEFAHLHGTLNVEGSGSRALRRLVGLATRSVPGCDWAGVSTWHRDGGITTVTVSDPVPSVMDEIQNKTGEGPGITVADCVGPVHAEDLAIDHRWPEFRRRALERTPVRSVLSFRFDIGATRPRSLNLYAARPRAFADGSRDLAALFATHVKALMAHAASADRANNLDIALRASRQIGTAVGVLMALRKVDAETAFELLSRTSQELNRKLREVAEDVVRTGALPQRPCSADCR